MSWVLFTVLALLTCTLTVWLVGRMVVSSHSEDRDDAPTRGEGSPAGPAAVRARPAAVFSLKSTTNIDRLCPNHGGQPAVWTCRFCKKDYCEQCSRVTGGQKHCPAKRCIEGARSFATSRKGQ